MLRDISSAANGSGRSEVNGSGRSYAGSLVGSDAMSMINKSETAARMIEDFFQSSYTIDKFLKVGANSQACLYLSARTEAGLLVVGLCHRCS